jgi:hypothetical protein
VAGGNPYSPFSGIGNGQAAQNAFLNSPAAVAADASGNVYIADTGNNAVRKVGANGVIGAFAGSGMAGFSGDGGPATSASVSFPQGLCVDSSGNLYIADTGNKRIRTSRSTAPATSTSRISRTI